MGNYHDCDFVNAILQIYAGRWHYFGTISQEMIVICMTTAEK